MKEKYITSGQNKLEILTDIFIFYILLIFPFIIDKTGYFHIFECKWNYFKLGSVVYILLTFFIIMYYLIIKKVNLFTNKKIKKFQIFLFIYLLICIISTFTSPYKANYNIIIGLGRKEGLLVNLMYIITFFFITFFGKYKKNHLLFLTISAFIESIICFFQYLGIDFLNMYQLGYGTHNASFMGTIGNIDFLSAFFMLTITPTIASFILLEKTKKIRIFELVTIFLTLFIFEIINVDSGKVALLGIIILFFPVLTNTNKKTSNLLMVISLFFLGYAFNIFLNPVYHYNINKLTLDFQINIMLIMLLIISISLILISFKFQKINYKIELKNYLKKYYIFIFSIGIFSLILLFIFDFKIGYLTEIHEILHLNLNDTFGNFRLFLWKRSIQLVKDYPLIGTGPDTFAIRFMSNFANDLSLIGSKTIEDTAANVYLTILVNNGILGLIFYLMFIFNYLKEFIKCHKESLVILIGVICYLIQDFFNLEIVIVTPIFWIITSLAYLSLQLNKKIYNKDIRVEDSVMKKNYIKMSLIVFAFALIVSIASGTINLFDSYAYEDSTPSDLSTPADTSTAADLKERQKEAAKHGYSTPANLTDEYDNQITLRDVTCSNINNSYYLSGNDSINLYIEVTDEIVIDGLTKLKNEETGKIIEINDTLWCTDSNDGDCLIELQLPDNIPNGQYSIYELKLTALNSDYTKYEKTYSKDGHNNTTSFALPENKFNIINSNSKIHGVYVGSTSNFNKTYKSGSKIKLYGSNYTQEATVTFINEKTKETFVAQHKDNKYIQLPNNIKDGTYYLAKIQGVYNYKDYSNCTDDDYDDSYELINPKCVKNITEKYEYDYSSLPKIYITIDKNASTIEEPDITTTTTTTTTTTSTTTTKKAEKVVKFTKNKNIYLILGGVGVFVIVSSLTAYLLIKNKKKNENK